MNYLKEAREIAAGFAAKSDYAPGSAEEFSDRIFNELVSRHPKANRDTLSEAAYLAV
ncbi:MAG TPA: hypothetical protein VJP02_26965 [Candidatus Sulfotelmatobacter sp.]|nr:hypothetical protein [Candidatus Sulfotelmatobacter sp.]